MVTVVAVTPREFHCVVYDNLCSHTDSTSYSAGVKNE